MIRIVTSALFGVALTAVVLWLMMRMVTPPVEPTAKRWTLTSIDFIRQRPVTKPPLPPDRPDAPLAEMPEPPPELEVVPPRPVSPTIPRLSDEGLKLDKLGVELEVRGAPFLGDLLAPAVSAPVPGPAHVPIPVAASGLSSGSALVLRKRIPPLYPLRARRRRIEGWVKVELRIDALGRVDDVRVVDSDPSGVFDRAALESVRRWRFRPLGDAAPVTAVQKIEFKLE